MGQGSQTHKLLCTMCFLGAPINDRATFFSVDTTAFAFGGGGVGHFYFGLHFWSLLWLLLSTYYTSYNILHYFTIPHIIHSTPQRVTMEDEGGQGRSDERDGCGNEEREKACKSSQAQDDITRNV